MKGLFKFALLGGILTLTGACSKVDKLGRGDTEELMGSIRYWKDYRVDKCYAFVWSSSGHQGGLAIANVDCDEKVEALLVNRR